LSTATTISKTDLVNKIIDALNDFDLDSIDTEATTVFVNKRDYSDVEVADSDFESFTESHATMASFFLDYEDGDPRINRRAIREWIESFDTEIA
jgi:hypothetical protein